MGLVLSLSQSHSRPLFILFHQFRLSAPDSVDPAGKKLEDKAENDGNTQTGKFMVISFVPSYLSFCLSFRLSVCMPLVLGSCANLYDFFAEN